VMLSPRKFIFLFLISILTSPANRFSIILTYKRVPDKLKNRSKRAFVFVTAAAIFTSGRFWFNILMEQGKIVLKSNCFVIDM
jgi:hypothetical protein